jgi:hypothetical protein
MNGSQGANLSNQFGPFVRNKSSVDVAARNRTVATVQHHAALAEGH